MKAQTFSNEVLLDSNDGFNEIWILRSYSKRSAADFSEFARLLLRDLPEHPDHWDF